MIDIIRNSEDFEMLFFKIIVVIYIIVIDLDLFFMLKENLEIYNELKKFKENVFYSEINLVYGYDVFLIEYK